MSGPPKLRSMNVADKEREAKAGVGHNGNTFTRLLGSGKHMSKLVTSVRKTDRVLAEGESEEKKASPSPSRSPNVVKKMPSSISNRERLLRSNYSMNASCSSDASSESFHSRASTGRITRSSSGVGSRRKPCSLKRSFSGSADVSVSLGDDVSPTIKRCAWVTPNTDPAYAAFHDEEWGVPQHDDKKLFELLVFCGALAELTWPTILSKRHIFREVFLDFDPIAVSKLNEKKLAANGSTATSLLSELKLHSVVQNAIQVTKVIVEFGSFDKYIWSFVNFKPINNSFRYPRQVPVKTPKAEVISKDLVRRGFRCVGPTVIYSFMQVTGITNDHLISCYRFNDCLAAAESTQGSIKSVANSMMELKPESDISEAIDEMSLSSE